jgi:glycosyltransferase involved in cell wall biosynthesis
VPAEDAHGLAQAVLRLYEMPAGERAVMGENGRRYFKEHFDHERLIGELIGHFRQVTKGVEDDV